MFIQAENTTTACLTENFKIYLEEMKRTFPDYGIGLSSNGKTLIDMSTMTEKPVCECTFIVK